MKSLLPAASDNGSNPFSGTGRNLGTVLFIAVPALLLLAALSSVDDLSSADCGGVEVLFEITDASPGDATVGVGNGDVMAIAEGILSVTIPERVTFDGTAYTVTSVARWAFSCSDLVSVDLPDTVVSIGNSAFSHSYDLVSVRMPDSLAFIGESAF